MSWLLDVNLLLACGWRSHRHHSGANAWLARQRRFFTCAIGELGFVRISMSPAYQAAFSDSQAALARITGMKNGGFLPDDLRAAAIPEVANYAFTTDAYLVALARKHSFQLATLDDALCRQPWAVGIAENPL